MFDFIANIWSQRWFKALVIVGGLVLVVAAIIRSLTPQPLNIPAEQVIVTNTNNTNTTYDNIKYQGITPQTPTELSVANFALSSTTLDEVLSQFITTYNLTDHINQNYWNGKNYSLALNPLSNQFTLSKSQVLSAAPNTNLPVFKKIDYEQAKVMADKNISALFPNLQLVRTDEKTQFFRSEALHYDKVAPDQADLIEFEYNYTINDIPVYYSNRFEPTVQILVNSNYEIEKLTFFPMFISINEVSTMPVISVFDAVAQINDHNLASLIVTLQEKAGQVNWSSMKSGTLHDAKLEYRYNPKSPIIYPFYRMTGDMITTSDENVKVEVITPAVRINQ